MGLALTYALTAPNIYQSTAIIMAIEDSKMGSGALNLGGLGAFGPLSGLTKSPNAKINAILNSRALAKDVWDRANIQKELFGDAWDEKSQTWTDKTKIPTEEDIINSVLAAMKFKDDDATTTISIKANFKDPIVAQRVARIYIEELRDFLNKYTLTQAQRDKLFLEEQVKINQKTLLEEGKTLSNFYQNNNVSSLRSMVNVNLGKPESSQAVTLIPTEPTPKNPIAQVSPEEKYNITNIPADIYLKYLGARQKLLLTLNGSLENQYQMAKIEAVHDQLGFQVIDEPMTPQKRFKPNRRLIVIVGTMAGIFFGVFYAFLAEFFVQNKQEIKRLFKNEAKV
jgi:uncharacterized protein involved in exopolysaccharide biosynthesis